MKLLLFLIVLIPFSMQSQIYKKSEPFTHTYSIVAIDEATGEMGVAVQSHWFSVGSLVIYGEAGVGVVATQSLVNPSYGPKGLALMKQGLTPQQALEALLMNDEGQAYRQVAMLNKDGLTAAYTGKLCIDMAGHKRGKNYSVQANMMLKNTVWDAMARAFENTSGKLAHRLMAALKAGEQEQGDIRGQQSAAILIVNPTATGNSWQDVKMELRVEDSDNPIDELERLIKVHEAYDYMNKGDMAMETGNSQEAETMYLNAQKLFPENIEMQYWYAINLLNNNEFEKAEPILKSIFEKNINWKTLTSRLMKSKLLTISSDDLKKVLDL